MSWLYDIIAERVRVSIKVYAGLGDDDNDWRPPFPDEVTELIDDMSNSELIDHLAEALTERAKAPPE